MAKIDKIAVDDTLYELVPEIAPLFDTTKAYNVGDCVINDAVLYRFTVAHAAGAWIGTDAEAITVGNELTDLKADLNDKANESTIAPEFDTSGSYTTGQYVYKNGVLYRFMSAHSGAWTGTDVEEVTVGGEVEELSSLATELKTRTNITPSSYTNNNYVVGANNNLYGKAYYGTNYKCTDYLVCSGYSSLELDVPKTSDLNPGVAFYDSENVPISGTGIVYKNISFGETETHKTMQFEIPSNASKMRITVLKSVEEYFFCALYKSKITEINEDIEELETKTSEIESNLKESKLRKYMVDAPIKALFPEFVSDFWCAMTMPSALSGKQVVFTVSGTQGDEYLTVSGIIPDTIQISDVSQWTGFVLTTDGVAYDVYNALYDATEAKLQIYPPLKESVTNARFSSVYLDGGTSYAGLHLTSDGYKAYIYDLYNKNPKHCEVGLYNESFNARTASTYPFQKISSASGTPLYLGMGSVSQNNAYLRNYFPNRFYAQFASSYTPYNTKNGVYWDVDLNGTSGYLEVILNTQINILKIPEGQELYVDVYIDGTLKSQTVITDAIGKRICVDYENATTGRLEIYCNKWAAVNGGGYLICISKAVWWINELKYKEDEKLFPVGIVVAQEFDSWGVFHDGITGVALNNLINADAGVTVPYYNHSLGDQTTAWGTAYWYQNIYAYNPQIAITDFQINDSNSVGSSGIPATITGPDGKTYNNKITVDDFVVNTKRLIDFAISNGIQPLIMRNFQHSYYRFIDAVIEAISQKYEP